MLPIFDCFCSLHWMITAAAVANWGNVVGYHRLLPTIITVTHDNGQWKQAIINNKEEMVVNIIKMVAVSVSVVKLSLAWGVCLTKCSTRQGTLFVIAISTKLDLNILSESPRFFEGFLALIDTSPFELQLKGVQKYELIFPPVKLIYCKVLGVNFEATPERCWTKFTNRLPI